MGTAGVINRLSSLGHMRRYPRAVAGELTHKRIKTMASQQEVQDAMVEWKRLHLPSCPVCSCKDSIVSEVICAMPALEKDQLFPVVPIVCRGCGYTVFVSAAALKLVQPIDQPRRID